MDEQQRRHTQSMDNAARRQRREEPQILWFHRILFSIICVYLILRAFYMGQMAVDLSCAFYAFRVDSWCAVEPPTPSSTRYGRARFQHLSISPQPLTKAASSDIAAPGPISGLVQSMLLAPLELAEDRIILLAHSYMASRSPQLANTGLPRKIQDVEKLVFDFDARLTEYVDVTCVEIDQITNLTRGFVALFNQYMCLDARPDPGYLGFFFTPWDEFARSINYYAQTPWLPAYHPKASRVLGELWYHFDRFYARTEKALDELAAYDRPMKISLDRLHDALSAAEKELPNEEKLHNQICENSRYYWNMFPLPYRGDDNVGHPPTTPAGFGNLDYHLGVNDRIRASIQQTNLRLADLAADMFQVRRQLWKLAYFVPKLDPHQLLNAPCEWENKQDGTRADIGAPVLVARAPRDADTLTWLHKAMNQYVMMVGGMGPVSQPPQDQGSEKEISSPRSWVRQKAIEEAAFKSRMLPLKIVTPDEWFQKPAKIVSEVVIKEEEL